jgi:hypothetical protein
MFNIGDEVRINIPKRISNPFDGFSTNWLNWIQSCRGVKLTVTGHNVEMNSKSGVHIGCRVDYKPKTEFTSNWIPNEWLIPYKDVGTFTANRRAGYDSGGDNISTTQSRIGYCVGCGGVGKHRLMCPAQSARA